MNCIIGMHERDNTVHNTVHFQQIEVGRDYGDKLEVLSGLNEGDTIIPRPSDAIREGTKVEPVSAAPKPAW